MAAQRINVKLVVQHWEGLLRLESSLKLGTVQAAGLIRTLRTKDRPTKLARALEELRRLIKTLHLLRSSTTSLPAAHSGPALPWRGPPGTASFLLGAGLLAMPTVYLATAPPAAGGATAGGAVVPRVAPGCWVGCSVPAAGGKLFVVFGVEALDDPAAGVWVVVIGAWAKAEVVVNNAAAITSIFMVLVP